MGFRLINFHLLLVLLFTVSCGFYSFSGSSLKGIKTIAVPLFDNQTTQYGIREKLTEKLNDAIISDNTLQVVNIRNADSALRGTVVNYENECYTFDAAGNCGEYISRVYVDAVFEDLEDNEIIWEGKNIEGYGIYSASSETEEDGIERALEKLSADIVEKVIRGW